MGRFGRGLGAVVLLTMLAGACAGPGPTALPPARALQPADLAELAGEWHGTLRATPGTGAVTGPSAPASVMVAADGSYTSNVNARPGSGTARIVGGRIVFEGSATRGEATLHEAAGRRVLRGQGTWVGFDGRSEFELTKR